MLRANIFTVGEGGRILKKRHRRRKSTEVRLSAAQKSGVALLAFGATVYFLTLFVWNRNPITKEQLVAFWVTPIVIIALGVLLILDRLPEVTLMRLS